MIQITLNFLQLIKLFHNKCKWSLDLINTYKNVYDVAFVMFTTTNYKCLLVLVRFELETFNLDIWINDDYHLPASLSDNIYDWQWNMWVCQI